MFPISSLHRVGVKAPGLTPTRCKELMGSSARVLYISTSNMNDQIVLDFLKNRCGKGDSLLLALSGGPDSEALLHSLLFCQKKMLFALHIAHVDHGWREDSKKEAMLLAKRARELGLPFHLKILSTDLPGNLEEACRVERLRFFKSVCDREGCLAVLLGHQADDVAETTLKRILEGARISVCGLRQESMWEGLCIWRPLLGVFKKDLLSYLQHKKISYFDDSTNRDVSYLRARTRCKILPDLCNSFGKNVEKNLLRFASRSNSLRNYLDERLESTLMHFKKAGEEAFFEMSVARQLPLVEKEHLFYTLFSQMKIDMSHAIFDKLLHEKPFLVRKENKLASLQSGFLLFLNEPPLTGQQLLSPGLHHWGSLQVEIVLKKQGNRLPPSGWQDLLMRSARYFLPVDDYIVKMPLPGDSFGGCRLNKWLAQNRVPPLLRNRYPVIYRKESVFLELLSGRNRLKPAGRESFFEIIIK